MQRRHLTVLTLATFAAAACSAITPAPAPAPTPAARHSQSTAVTLGIPPGQLPPPGACRVWRPGVPPGHQARARSCTGIERSAPAGSWIVYRPARDRKVVHVRLVDERRPGVVIRVRVFDARSGALIREG